MADPVHAVVGLSFYVICFVKNFIIQWLSLVLSCLLRIIQRLFLTGTCYAVL
jgi:hypothetical protein